MLICGFDRDDSGRAARALEPFPPIRTLDALCLSTIEFVRNRRETVEFANYVTNRHAAAQVLRISIAAL